jgi:hypothetical protein
LLLWYLVRHTASQGILEDLLEAQELEDGQVDCGMQAEATLVGSEGRVELHAVALVDLALALVGLPDDAELDDALGDGDDLEGLLILGVLLEEARVFEGGDELWGKLVAIWDRSIGDPAQQTLATYPCAPARTLARTW